MSSIIRKWLLNILVLSALCATQASARPVPSWPYEKLVAESDVVAIIEPLENKPAQDAFPGDNYGHSTNDFVGVDTRFKVHAVLKGGTLQDLTLLHFSYSTNVISFDGACFVRFLIGPLQYEQRALRDGKPVGGVTTFRQQPVWLAFLKRRADGRFEPLTGHYDSTCSFRELHESSFYAKP